MTRNGKTSNKAGSTPKKNDGMQKIAKGLAKLAVQNEAILKKTGKVVLAGARSGGFKGAAKAATKFGLSMMLKGHGDYIAGTSPNVNSLINPTTATTGAEFSNNGRRGVRVVESEFLGDVLSGADLSLGSSTFDLKSFRVNPSDPLTFPWLSQFAALYDQWLPHGIVFEYRSSSSEFNGTSQSLGVVMAAADYDAADPSYIDKRELENADYSVSCKSSENFSMGIECDPSERPTRVLYTGETSGSQTSANFHDLCRVQLATQGMSTAGTTLGEWWVHYDITFFKKQMIQTLNPAIMKWRTVQIGGDLVAADKWNTGTLDGFDGNGLQINASAIGGRVVLTLTTSAPLGRYGVWVHLGGVMALTSSECLDPPLVGADLISNETLNFITTSHAVLFGMFERTALVNTQINFGAVTTPFTETTHRTITVANLPPGLDFSSV